MAQLKSGKFRKIASNFNLKSAIEEIMDIQRFQSELKNVKMSLDFIDFPAKYGNNERANSSLNLLGP